MNSLVTKDRPIHANKLKKADEYFAKVTEKVAKLILDTRRKWDMAGL